MTLLLHREPKNNLTIWNVIVFQGLKACYSLCLPLWAFIRDSSLLSQHPTDIVMRKSTFLPNMYMFNSLSECLVNQYILPSRPCHGMNHYNHTPSIFILTYTRKHSEQPDTVFTFHIPGKSNSCINRHNSWQWDVKSTTETTRFKERIKDYGNVHG